MGWEELGHVIRDQSQYIGWFTVIGGAVFAISKKCREKIKAIIVRNSNTTEIEKDLKSVKEDIEKILAHNKKSDAAQMALLRNEITGIYYENVEKKKLKSYQKENLAKLYDAYIEEGGNSYVQLLVEDEMSHWETEP